jgi:ATP-binding cassette subfamily B protein
MAAKRSQIYFAGQQRILGELNGHVEEMYTGHQVVKAFGHEKDAIARFNEYNEKLYAVGWKAQFVSGVIMPMLAFINNIGYVLVCVLGGIFVTRGNLRSVCPGILPVFQTVFPTHIQTAKYHQHHSVHDSISVRVFEVLDEAEEIPDRPDAMGLDDPVAMWKSGRSC